MTPHWLQSTSGHSLHAVTNPKAAALCGYQPPKTWFAPTSSRPKCGRCSAKAAALAEVPTRDPRANPLPGDAFWIGQGNACRVVVENDGVVVTYAVGVHRYQRTIADFRRMVAGSAVREVL